jgi:hypothetical protein
MLNQYYNVVSERTTIVSLALEAAASGMAVFPLAGKLPTTGATPNGYKNASRDPSRITAMFNAAGKRATGYGIATGAASGIVVVDVDGPDALDEAKRLGLTSGYVVKTGRPEGGGFHLYYATCVNSTEVKSRDLAEGLELKGEGCYVVGAGSKHPLGDDYRVVRDGKPSPAPPSLTEPPKALRGQADTLKMIFKDTPVVLDVAGPPIPEGGRNLELARIAGRLHDGSRDLDTLTRDLEAINAARCSPPLESAEVASIAKSISGKAPCSAAPTITPRVKAAVDYLRSVERPVTGMAGATGWSVYRAGLAACSEFGREHPEGVTLSMDVRSWAQRAGTSKSALSRALRRSPLMRVIEPGRGKKSATVLFVAPKAIGHKVGHSSTRGVSIEHEPFSSVPLSALLPTLERLRWGPGRIGKSKAALLHALVECNGPLSRSELASKLGRKPASLRAPLQWLTDTGLLERVARGVYQLPADFEERVEEARELGREPEADRLQIARHAGQRDAFALAWARGEVVSKKRLAKRRRHRDDDGHGRRGRDLDGHGRRDRDLDGRGRRDRDLDGRGRRDRDLIRPEERAPSGTIADLERVPEPAPALVEALREYLTLNPRLVDEGPSWLAGTLWAYDRVTGKPTPEAVEAALSVIECENRAA